VVDSLRGDRGGPSTRRKQRIIEAAIGEARSLRWVAVLSHRHTMCFHGHRRVVETDEERQLG
jgi:hypothetical protein